MAAPAGWSLTPHELPSAFAHPLQVQVCSPHGVTPTDPAPLLWVHDGPAYAEQAGLLDWIVTSELPPMRVVLAGVRRRSQWYSASPRYLHSFSMGLSTVQQLYAVRSPVVVMGASLGGLTSLLVGLTDERVGAVFAQSGSYFTAATDQQESTFGYFERITSAVAAVATTPLRDRAPVQVEMTCGIGEENLPNNVRMAQTLTRAGITAHLTEVDGGHDYASWRAACDPTLPTLLRRTWGKPHGESYIGLTSGDPSAAH